MIQMVQRLGSESELGLKVKVWIYDKPTVNTMRDGSKVMLGSGFGFKGWYGYMTWSSKVMFRVRIWVEWPKLIQPWL